ncbi:uncharacterized protein LOC134212893 isoform X2 [Armigeres subalbatus]|uniref:uncharacterized protein LOC134212893 isoform X2 n=1 Tax=Armigeres subalbatus TaxID=124917 RepID=UPI002ED435C8
MASRILKNLFLVQLYCTVQAAVTVLIEEDLQECDNGMPLTKVDITGVQIITEENGTLTVNGTARFDDEYGSPTMWKMYSKRLQRGQWVTGLLSREIWNLCPVLLSPNELWYPLMVKMHKNRCPFPKGYEEHMNMVNLGNPAHYFKIPPDFIGEWQVYNEITTSRRGHPEKECFLIKLTITEV